MNNILWIKTKCSDNNKLIQKLSMLNIHIFEIKYSKDYIYLKVTLNDYKKINKYLVSYKFKKYKNTGINKILDYIKKEYIFLIAIIIGIGLLFILKNLIVDINIIHENKEIREILKEELDYYGIKVLSFKKSYKKLDKIRKEILDKYPDRLDWIEFEEKGMVLNLRVEERIITKQNKNKKVCNLVATDNGIVSDLVVYKGEANVTLNDYVRKGDVLVKGVVLLDEKEKRHVCASGEVYATTWYTVNVKIPYNYEETKTTGKKRYNLVWENNGIKKEIFKSRIKNHDSKYKTLFKFFDFKIYLETEEEITKIKKVYTKKEAINKGVEKAVESLKEKLQDKDTIIDKKVLKKVVNNSTMDIEVFIVVKKLISMEKIIEVDERK